MNLNNVLLPSGNFSITGVDANRKLINFSAPNGGTVMTVAVKSPVSNGAITQTVCVPRSDRASVYVRYHFVVTDNSASGTHAIVVEAWDVPITSDIFSLDTYAYPANAYANPPNVFTSGNVNGDLHVTGTVYAGTIAGSVAENANHANTADYATTAGTANTANNANHATTADSATTAGSAATAANATHANSADTATTAGTATTANSANHATTADSATTAGSAATAANATHANSADTATTAGALAAIPSDCGSLAITGINADGSPKSCIPAGSLSGTNTPKGISANYPDQTYYQLVSVGPPQGWTASTHMQVWTNTVTGQRVYAGPPAMYTAGFTQCHEFTDGSGTAPLDSCGHAASSLVGSPAPVWNGTNGLTFNGTYQAMVQLSNTTLIPHSTYLFCFDSPASSYSNVNPRPFLLNQIASGPLVVGLDQYGSLGTGGAAGVGNYQTSLQTISDGVPVCATVVYDGSGNDQFYIGSTRLAVKNPGNTLQTITAGAGLGVYFIGHIYKFYAIEGTELAEDYIQHNALVASERVATGTGLAVPTTPAGYQAGNMSIWYVGDSRYSGNGDITRSPGYYINQNQQIPNFTLYNAGTSAQRMCTYTAAGIFGQAPSLLNQLTLPGSTPPPHVLIQGMGINDIGAGVTGATVYGCFTTAMQQTYGSGWKTIIETLYPSVFGGSSGNTERLNYNALLGVGGKGDLIVDIANDPHFVDRTGTLDYSKWGLFSPYYIDGLHPTADGAKVIAGRELNAIRKLGFIGKGTTYTVPYSPNLVFDLANGDVQQVTLTGNVPSLKVINGQQGQSFTLNFIQDAVGSHFVGNPTPGNNATASVTSAGIVTLLTGGARYDQNYQPTVYTAGLTCTTYPRYSSTITNGAITALNQIVAPVGCSGTGTVQFLSTEPLWLGNFPVSTAPNAVSSLQLVFDNLGQNIYSVGQPAGPFVNGNLRSTDSAGNEIDSGLPISLTPQLNALQTWTQRQTFNQRPILPGIAVSPACYNTLGGSPINCLSYSAGSVRFNVGATNVTVNTTQAGSTNVFFTYSTQQLGSAPTNMSTLGQPYISAVSPGVSFTISLPTAPTGIAIDVGWEQH